MKSTINEGNICGYKEFKITKDNSIYNLKIEIEKEYIIFELKNLNNSLDYFYRNKANIDKLLDKINLNQEKKLNKDFFVKLFDKREENKIIINNINNDQINIQFINSNNINFEINLIKEIMTIDDKLNIIYNEILSRRHNNYIIENSIKFQIINKYTTKTGFLKDKEENNKIFPNEIINKPINNNLINIDDLYRKIEEINKEQKRLYDSIINEFNEMKNNIENRIYKYSNIITRNENETNNIPPPANYIINKTPSLNSFPIRYKIDKNDLESIKIFGYKFVEKNINNYKIIYNEEEYKLSEVLFINNKDKNRGYVDIILKDINNSNDMSYIFNGINSVIDISNWNTSNITNMSYMFSDSYSKIDISNWDTSNVTNMSHMFYNFHSIIPDISNWNISNVTNMNHMFYNCHSIIPNISKWNTVNLLDMSYMFYECSSTIPDISYWNTSNVKNMSYLFCKYGSALPDISKWDTSKVTNMAFMFGEYKSLIPDISNWNTSNVTNMSSMFLGCSSLFYLSDISKWNTSKVNDMNSMFYDCTSLLALPDISKWDTSNVKNMSYMFYSCKSLTHLPDISKWKISNNAYLGGMFQDCSKKLKIPSKFKKK